MVVNRRQPSTPAPPVAMSRSSSQQIVPTRKIANANAKLVGKDRVVGAALVSDQGGSVGGSTRTPKTTQVSKSKPSPEPKRSRSLLDTLFLLSLFLFTCYAFLTCHPSSPLSLRHTTPQPLLCRSLTTYRTHILEPYVLPPLTHSLRFSAALAEPYVHKAKDALEPYTAPVGEAVEGMKPYVRRSVEGAREVWVGWVVPAYRDTVKPWFDSAVAPRYELYIRPRLAPLSAQISRQWTYYVALPLRTQSHLLKLRLLSLYTAHLHPYTSQVSPYIHRALDLASTTTIQARAFYDASVQPVVLASWTRAKPVLCAAYAKARALSAQAAKVAARQGKWVLKELGVRRREWVDPHVRRIWDKVAENATGTVVASESEGEEEKTMMKGEEVHSHVEAYPDTQETAEVIPEPTARLVDLPIAIPVPTTDSSPSFSAEPELSAQPTPTPSASATPTPVHKEEEAQAALSIAHASAHEASTVIYELEREAASSLLSKVEAGETPAVTRKEEPGVQATALTVVLDPAHTEAAPTPEAEAEVEEKVVPTPAPTPKTVAKQGKGKGEPMHSAASIEHASLAGAGGGGDARVIGGVGASSTTSTPEAAEEDDELDDFLKDLGVSSPSSPSSDRSDSQQPDEKSEEQTQQSEADATASAAAALASTAAKRLDITTRHSAWESTLSTAIVSESEALAGRLTEIRERGVLELQDLGGTEGGEGGLVGEVAKEGERLVRGLEGYLRKAESRSSAWKLSSPSSSSSSSSSDSSSSSSEEKKQEKEQKKAKAKEEQEKFGVVLGKVESKFAERVEGMRGDVHAWWVGLKGGEVDEVCFLSLLLSLFVCRVRSLGRRIALPRS
ncbi:hypothetical protein B0H34DRAFT_419842 [Crassisporium funariophilum]|nr:hypothetical protein B0H34DRAFT_419842 [Crassisporium funariophilum]